jgi:hypothetical protein
MVSCTVEEIEEFQGSEQDFQMYLYFNFAG